MKIKLSPLLLLAAVCCNSLFAQLKTPQSLRFDGDYYTQVLQQGNGVESNRVTEYLRSPESINGNWHRMFAIWEFPRQRDVQAYATNMVQAHQQKNPQLEHGLLVKDDNSEALVYFMEQGGGVIEYNIYRIFKKNGRLVAYQYTCRNYANDAEQVDWANKRTRWIDEICRLQLVN